MNRDHEARLRRLEARKSVEGDTTIIFRWTTADDGTVESYSVLNNNEAYTPEQFDRLVDEHADTVFVPLQAPSALAKAASIAYWEEHEANMPTWDELLMENAEAERVRETGDAFNPACSPRMQRMGIGSDDAEAADTEAADTEAADTEVAQDGTGDASDEGDGGVEGDGGEEDDGDEWVKDVTVDSVRATLARYHAWLMEQSTPWYEEMGRRKARLDEQRPY